MVIFAIGSQISYLNEFVQVFGIRFLGLHDPGSTVYSIYRVPRPEAPYPQDFIIDQQGIVRYWSDEYNPQEIMHVIDELLAAGIEEEKGAVVSSLDLIVIPNPTKGFVAIEAKGELDDGASFAIYDVIGRLVHTQKIGESGILCWKPDAPSGIYFIKLRSGGRTITRNLILTH